jgi:molybdopterin molybdotransferase
MATAVATETIVGRTGRTDAIRGRAWRDGAGRLLAVPTENRGSSVMSSLPDANCLILLNEETDTVEADETISISWVGYQ